MTGCIRTFMKKIILLLAVLYATHQYPVAQPSTGRMLFVIDSVPVFYDLNPLNDLREEDIASRMIVKNDKGLQLAGASAIDSITYIFTNKYLSRPDSIKQLPSLKQMEMKDSAWHFKGVPYTGKYVEYYFSGNKFREGSLLNGRLHGEEIYYFQNGRMGSVQHYTNGKQTGPGTTYYKNGGIRSKGVNIEDWKGEWESYFPDGLIESRGTAPDSTGCYTMINYLSSGKIKQVLSFYKNGNMKKDSAFDKSILINKMLEQMKKAAGKHAAKKMAAAAIRLNSANADVYSGLGFFMFDKKYFSEAIAAFDKALEIEPYLIQILFYRALARINKNGPERKWVKQENSETPILTPFDKNNVPPAEREKICSDLKRATALRTIFSYSFDFLLVENAAKYCDMDLRR